MKKIHIQSILILGIIVWVGCVQAEQIGLGTNSYFSFDYQEARYKFLDASTAIGAKIESFKNPNSGPEGEPLFTDVALIGPKDAKDILVLGSGTHGVEGFAGSGIQTGLLRQGIALNMKPNMSIVMIHAINPYGFAHLRRFNEDNVDLNRNFVDHTRPYLPDQGYKEFANEGYHELANAISPKSISFWSNSKDRFQSFLVSLEEWKEQIEGCYKWWTIHPPTGSFLWWSVPGLVK